MSAQVGEIPVTWRLSSQRETRAGPDSTTPELQALRSIRAGLSLVAQRRRLFRVLQLRLETEVADEPRTSSDRRQLLSNSRYFFPRIRLALVDPRHGVLDGQRISAFHFR